MADSRDPFARHVERLRACRVCPNVFAPPVVGAVRGARIFLLGQAPGPRERVYMGAVIRCFPGKLAGGQGDRRPSAAEIEACGRHFDEELALLRPELVLAVGRMAIERLMPGDRLDALVGRAFPLTRQGHSFTCVPLPHPSGLNRWLQTEQGKALLGQGLALIARHPAWQATFGEGARG